MPKTWNLKIHKSIKKEFPADPMMQELHELRARLAKNYKLPKNGLFLKIKKKTFTPEKVKAR